MFGELALLSKRPRMASSIAQEDTHLAVFDAIVAKKLL